MNDDVREIVNALADDPLWDAALTSQSWKEMIERILAALDEAGYEVVPRAVADAAQKALLAAPMRFAGRDAEVRAICSEWRFERKRHDPLPERGE